MAQVSFDGSRGVSKNEVQRMLQATEDRLNSRMDGTDARPGRVGKTLDQHGVLLRAIVGVILSEGTIVEEEFTTASPS